MLNVFGNQKKSYLNGIEIEVISSKVINREVEVTSRRVEKGFVISDTARKQPYTIDLEIVDNSENWEYNREEFRKLTNGIATTFIYSNGEIHENMIVESFQEQFKVEQSKRGATYQIRLKQVIEGVKAEEVFKIAPQAKVATGRQNQVATQEIATKTQETQVKKSALMALIG